MNKKLWIIAILLGLGSGSILSILFPSNIGEPGILTGALIWLWGSITDAAIAGAIKPRMMFFGVIATVITWYVRRTKSTADDELLDSIKRRLFPGSE